MTEMASPVSSSGKSKTLRVLAGFVALGGIVLAVGAWYYASPVRPLARTIRRGDPEQRATAIHEMAQVVETPIDVQIAVPVLIEALKDPVMEVRAEAAQAFALIYSPRAPNQKGNPSRKPALDICQDEVGQALERSFGDPEGFVRQTAVGAYLVCMQTDRRDVPPPALVALVDDPSEGVRGAAIRGFASYDKGPETLLRVGLKRFLAEGPLARRAFNQVFASARFRRDHVPMLMELLESPEESVRLMGIRGLARAGAEGRSAIPALIAYIRRERDRPQEILDPSAAPWSNSLGVAITALVDVTPEGQPADEVVRLLREFLAMPRFARLQPDLAYWLAVLGPPARAAIPDLLRIFDSLPPRTHDRQQVARSLAHLARGTDAQPEVLAALIRAWKATPRSDRWSDIDDALIELRPDSEKLLPEVRQLPPAPTARPLADFRRPVSPR